MPVFFRARPLIRTRGRFVPPGFAPAGTAAAVASASGVGVATGIGASTAASTGAAVGTGVATGIGASTAASTASATGSGTATGIGRSFAASTAAASGSGTATGIGAAIFAGVGSASGTGVATGIGRSTAASTASASGTGTATGIGSSTAASVASASGTGTATGVGTGILSSVGSASGTGTAIGIGTTISTGSVASASGTGVATGIGATVSGAVGSASGTGTAIGVGVAISTGADNPTFTGTPDERTTSEYMTVDGGDYFDEVSNGSEDVSWHKAGGNVTLMAIVWPTGSTTTLLANRSSASNVGIAFKIESNTLKLRRSNGASNQDISLGSVTPDAWNFVAISLDESAGALGSHYRIGTSTGTFNGAASSPSSASPTDKIRILGNPDGSEVSSSGNRLMSLNVWSRSLSSDELDLLYHHWKTRRMGGVL